MKKNFLISVIIPVFNAEKTIKKTIESALGQEYKNFELIAVNDGSTDSTQQILEKFGKKIKIIRQKNQGISSARNNGAKKAEGEIIAFLDSDVVVEKNWIEELVKTFFADDSIFAVSGKLGAKTNGSLASDFFSFTISSSSFQGYNIAFKRKDFLEIGGYNNKIKYCEDPELIWRAFNAEKKFAIAEKALSFHEPYSLKGRLKANFKYAFWDAVVIKKYFFSFLRNPLEFFCRAPANLRYILGFYSVVFFSFLAAVFGLLMTKKVSFVLFLFLPSIFGSLSIISKRKKAKHEHNIIAIACYSFLIIFLFSIIKGTGFLAGVFYEREKAK